MKNFIYKFFKLILIPAFLMLVLIIYWDPFMVFFNYQEYYKNNVISLNRENVCFRLLNNQIKNQKSNFIIGSSRSIAFKTANWSKLTSLNPEKCFHYDANHMSLYKATKAIKYIDKTTSKIDNILLIMDTDFFHDRGNPKGHLVIQPPKVALTSRIRFFWVFIKASFNPEFIVYNLIFKLFGKHYKFMGHHILRSHYYHVSNNSTGDLWFGNDMEIRVDSINYYNKLLLSKKGGFYNSQIYPSVSVPLIDSFQNALLSEIKMIVNKNNCVIKIVISPLYNQIRFNDVDKQKLVSLFGKNNVFDFSGKNTFTTDYTNYYESSHYKPHVANRIMKIIYDKSQKQHLSN